MDAEVKVLLGRVLLGNARLYEAWQSACATDNSQDYEAGMVRIARAWGRLDTLCQALMSRGFTSCLYDSPRCSVSDSRWFCYVCPSAGRQWNKVKAMELVEA